MLLLHGSKSCDQQLLLIMLPSGQLLLADEVCPLAGAWHWQAGGEASAQSDTSKAFHVPKALATAECKHTKLQRQLDAVSGSSEDHALLTLKAPLLRLVQPPASPGDPDKLAKPKNFKVSIS